MTGRKPKRFTAFLWHRRIGLLAAVLVVILAVTGILLNHTETFRLDERYVSSHLLLGWYGLEPQSAPLSYRAGNHTVTQWDGKVFFDDHLLAVNEQALTGAVWAEQLIVIAFRTELLLVTHEGELIERVPTGQTFSAIQRIGIRYQRPVIETPGPLYYMADEHILDWDLVLGEEIAWAEQAKLDDAQLEALLTTWRGKGLTMERVVLDLHSGRLFGDWGVYLMDAAAIGLLWLSGSGVWVWYSRRRKQERKRHYRKHHRH